MSVHPLSFQAVRHRGYLISYWPKPIPDQRFDYDYVHEDYDGAEDAYDQRFGSAASVEDCQAEIDNLIEEDPDVYG